MLVQPNYEGSWSSDRSMYLPVQVLIPSSCALLSLSLCSFVASVTLLFLWLFHTIISLALPSLFGSLAVLFIFLTLVTTTIVGDRARERAKMTTAVREAQRS